MKLLVSSRKLKLLRSIVVRLSLCRWMVLVRFPRLATRMLIFGRTFTKFGRRFIATSVRVKRKLFARWSLLSLSLMLMSMVLVMW